MPYFQKQKFRKQSKTQINDILNELRKKGLAQPIRTQPEKDVMRATDLLEYLSKLTHKDVKKWGKYLIADMKYQGIRGLIVIDPKNKQVYVYSRNMKRLYNFEEKYGKKIFEDLANWVDEPTIIDAELYAVSKEGEPLPQPVETGWAKNPNNYPDKEIKPNIRAFDVLVADGKDIHLQPLEKRKEVLDKLLDYEGGVLFVAESRKILNRPSSIKRMLKEALQEKTEGLVLKDPNSPYFQGKIQNPDKNPWRKVKLYDTIDLRLKRVTSYPENKDKVWFYKHWYLTPEDKATHETEADKGIRNANLSHGYYAKFTKQLLLMVKAGRARASKDYVSIDPDKTVVIDGKRVKLIDYYGTDKIPKEIIIKKDYRPIVEVYSEQITPDLKLSGVKIIGIREDKYKADTLGTIRRLYRLYYSLSPMKRKARQYLLNVVQKKKTNYEKLLAMLNYERPDVIFKEAYELGVLKGILPQLNDLKGVTQRSIFHPENTVFGHIMSMLKQTNKLEGELSDKQMKLLKLAVLLHDIGKTNDIKVYDKAGRSWFPNHAEKSYEMAKAIIKNWPLSEQEKSDLLYIVKNHMIFNKYLKMDNIKKQQLISSRVFPVLAAHFCIDGLNILSKRETLNQLIKDVTKSKLPEKQKNQLLRILSKF